MFAKKSLGQHFLRSPATLVRMIEAGRVSETDTVLEIGPGEGVLTEKLLEKAGKVISVEKDDRLIPILEQKFAREIASGQLELVHSDILDFDPKSSKLQALSYKLVANIPYYISGAIFEKFLAGAAQPSLMVLLVQKEVAKRIVANDGKAIPVGHAEWSPDRQRRCRESLLSISVKAYGVPSYIATVSAGNFVPKPKVDSAVLLIDNISKKFFDGINEENFFRVVKTGFAHKRKQLASNLKEMAGGKMVDIFEKLNINPKTRAEDLSLNDWEKMIKLI